LEIIILEKKYGGSATIAFTIYEWWFMTSKNIGIPKSKKKKALTLNIYDQIINIEI
jgi:hypothetical protein